jgi:NAD(P)H-nitrite reductase large subunit
MDKAVRTPRGRRAPIRHLILGNSVAGIAAAQEIRRHDPEAGITIVSDERLYGYSRAMLPLYIAGKKTKQELVFAPREFYTERRIRLLRGAAVEAVEPGERRVRLADGKRLPYDRLLVATGSGSRSLNVPGAALPGVFPLRKFADAEAIKRHARTGRRVVIVGGGLVGVKSLEAMAARKKEIHLLISSDRILSQMLDRTASDLFRRAFERQGVQIHFHTDVAAFHGRERLEEVALSDGTRLPCDLAIIGKGVDPSVACLAGTGVRLSQGVVVDGRMASSLPGIYAAGDVAEPLEVLQQKNLPSTIWPSATEGGRVAGLNMVGVPATFSGALRMNSVEILGVRVISAGLWEGGEQATRLDAERSIYRKLIFADGRLNGFLLLGDVRCAGVLTALVKNRTEVSPQALAADLDRGFSYRPRLYALGGSIQAGR